MTEDQLRSMSEQEIRARFHCAPAYYLQAKLEKRRALLAKESQLPGDAESRWESAPTEQSQWQAALPGFDILDAALSEADDSRADAAHIRPAEQADTQTELTQQAILEAALEDYSTWPVLREPESTVTPAPEPEPASELEHKLTLVLDSVSDLELARAPESEVDAEPEFEPVLEMELDLELVLDSDPSLDLELESDAERVSSNVTMADFGHRAPRTVPVVSVAMDRKRPNMVRVVSKSTRLAG